MPALQTPQTVPWRRPSFVASTTALVPTLVYVTLAPFLEVEDAYEIAIG